MHNHLVDDGMTSVSAATGKGQMSESRLRSTVVTTLHNGQLTIPAEFRRALAIDEDAVLEVALGNGRLTITPVRSGESTPTPEGSPWLRDLYELFAPVREEAQAYSEVEIDAAIDAAVKAVRSKRA